MDKQYIDLHVHTFYSDGSTSPDEIVKEADKNNVGVIAVADHDLLHGYFAIRDKCAEQEIKLIPAVEIDTLDGSGNYFHVLAYGFDADDSEFSDFLAHTRFLLDEASVKLVEAMQGDYDGLSLPDFMDFTYDRRLGGWKALHYFMDKGLTSSLKEGIKFYPQYNITYDKSGYSSVRATAYRIKKAGGYSVLAHPGEMIASDDIGAFRAELERLVSYGLDGIECYYPTHSETVTQACLDICHENGLMITAGSDCHGSFGETRVGEMNITLDKLKLRDLLSDI